MYLLLYIDEPTEETGQTLLLDSVSYIGIIVSLCCLTITIMFYLVNKKIINLYSLLCWTCSDNIIQSESSSQE